MLAWTQLAAERRAMLQRQAELRKRAGGNMGLK
ncbi:hypothetical protein PM3016_1329 [Paenibacillus mucilaginosus 3016]|uniref:Uncharacterized protein n=1 Tax=Paenibacillus mucilaginosus 3016 TaxID=1116391 RepID=H6NC64_9BACL|nr:hypothetical protein PM3016_1329 [Paenibacillus mucilaginosus 3016]